MGSEKDPRDDEDVDDTATELYDEVDLEDLPEAEAAPPKPPSPMVVGMLDLDVDLSRYLEEDVQPELTLPLPEDGTWNRLHPASLVVNLIPRTLRVIWGFWPLLLIFLVGGVAGGPGLDDIGFIALFMLSGVGSTVVHFLTLRYRVHNGKVEIKQGLLNRQARVIDPARIQNVGLVRNPFHRMSGLVEVRLETAGDVRTEGLLSALSIQDATLFMQQLAALRGKQDAQQSPSSRVLNLSLGELIAYGLSKPSAGYVVVLLFAVLEVAPILSPQRAAQALENLDGGLLAGLVLLAFAASWGGTAMLSIVRHYGFELRREGLNSVEDMKLRSREGLLTTREVEVPVKKVQLVIAEEPLVRRWMGFGTVSVETAGLGSLREGVQAAELVVPMVDRDQLSAVTRTAIPRNTVNPWKFQLKPAHPRALWRLMVHSVIRSTLLAVPLVALFWPLGLLALLLYPIGLLSAWLDYRYQGWLITPEVIIARRGFWRRRTYILARNKLQSVHLVQGPFMRGYGLGRIVLRVAGSQVVLPDVAWTEAQELLERLRPQPGDAVVSYR